MIFAAAVVPARAQMGSSLGFHIILACFGVAFPAIALSAEWIGVRRGDPVALLLARRWSKVMAVLFAVGAVSGTVLSYEMGLLWPGLMGRFGEALGIPFTMEAVFFFLEAIFTGIYLYGWDRLSPRAHLWSGIPLPITGALGLFSVLAANSWMNSPAGYTMRHGRIASIDPWAVFFNASTPYESAHMLLAAYMVTGFTIAGVYATGMLRGRRDHYHRLGLRVSFLAGATATPLQAIVGDSVARFVEHTQPVKFAAMEYVPNTARDVPEYLGGVLVNGKVDLALNVPGLDSILVGWTPSTKVIGYRSVPPDRRPPLMSLIHLSFDLMVVIAFALLALVCWAGWVWWYERRWPKSNWFLVCVALSGVASIAAMESGWIVTEVGRQPWVVYGVELTSAAVTRARGVGVTLGVILAVYLVITVCSIAVPMMMSRRWRNEPPGDEGASVPYGPPDRQAAPR